jgi:choline dehydrogenase-like flavoprotein
MAPFPMNDTDLLVKAAGERLGIQMHSVPVARNSVPYDSRSACSYYGTCRACPIGAMYSSDQTIARLERSPRFRVTTGAEATRVELDEQGRARRVVYLDDAGREHAAEAGIVILAVQSVETVRILLASACRSHRDGLGNSSGTLGRYFIEHPKFYLRGRVRQRLHPFRQGFETATTYQFHDHPRRDEYAGGRLLVRENAGPSPAMIAAQSGKWGRELRDEVQEIFGRYVTLGAFLEQLPLETNRITLSDQVKRRDGTPAAKVEFKLVSAYEQRGFEAMRDVMLGILAELGADDVEVVMPPSNSGHYMGGHRMGWSAADSVTDANLEVHEVPGLFLASGGAFPTSGIANPTLTTVALTLRMADHIVPAAR